MSKGRTSRRSKRRQARTDEILDAAMSEIVASGLEGLTVGKLAKRLDYTPGALYRYFSSKDAILSELQVRVIQDVHEGLIALWERTADVATNQKLTAEQATLLDIVAAGDLYRELNDKHPRRSQLIRLALAEPTPLVNEETFRVVMMPAARLLDDVAQRFEAAVNANALEAGHGHERAIVLWTSLQGVTSVAKLGRYGDELFAPRRLADNLLRALLIGWGATVDDFATARRVSNGMSDTAQLIDTVGSSES